MAKKKRLAGRFLPSRVYARWKWTVRFGLSALPLILFLSGATTLYLSQARYRSTAVFEYLGSRPAGEVTGLLKSWNVVKPAVSSLDLVQRFTVDSETAVGIVDGLTETSVDAASGLIRVEVTHTDKEIARDLAATLVSSLDDYEKSLVTAGIRKRLELAENELTAAEDEAEQKQEALARLIALRGNDTQDPVARLDLDAARVSWEHARTSALDAGSRIAAHQRELANPGKWVVMHTPPVISSKAVTPEKSWTYFILSAIGTGLAFALVIPYLLELAFPRVYRPGRKGQEPWTDEIEAAELARQPA
ncbi:MAG: hypothetical protein EOP88_13990 [Verrucomicrobiaceae bacterium]|nr:MAG: hypothetical protein EOP88_13990 [Verrucomicrobiaceae bacterium]